MVKKMLKKWLLKKLSGVGLGLLKKLAGGLLRKASLRSILSEGLFRQFFDKQRDPASEPSGSDRGYGNGPWQPPASARPYLSRIYKAEARHSMPENLLARLIYQESRYRDDIITGRTISSAGAVGIAQIVPKWHPDVNPLNPDESIDYAGKYLSQLQRQFGDWPTALAAYNWGQGNVRNAQKKHGKDWLNNAPRETRNYVAQIWGDIA